MTQHLIQHEIINNDSLWNYPHTSSHIPAPPPLQTPPESVPDVTIQTGSGSTEDPYSFERTGQKTFSKNSATETTYRIKFTDVWKGKKIKDILKQLVEMFDDVLNRAKILPM